MKRALNHAVALTGILFILSFLGKTSAASDYFEQPTSYNVSHILPQDMVSSPLYRVDETVRYDGFLYHFMVHTKYGRFQVASQTSLSILIRELDAIAAMRQVELSDTFERSLVKSGENTVKGLKNLLSDPQSTLEGAGQGISALFSRATETVGRRELTDAEDSRVEQLVGLTKSKGDIATRYGVSIYSQNEVLQNELDNLARADYLGGITVGLATSSVSGVGGIILPTSGTARLLNEAINTTSAAELWLQNKNKLLAMGVDADSIELFLNNPVFTPALETVIVTALEKMEQVANRELFVKICLQASTTDMARVISELAVMAAEYHNHIAPLKKFTPMARLLKATKKDGNTVLLLPIDHLIWTKRTAASTADIVQQGMDSGITGFEVWILGTLSEQTRSSLRTMGWQIHEHARNTLFKRP